MSEDWLHPWNAKSLGWVDASWTFGKRCWWPVLMWLRGWHADKYLKLFSFRWKVGLVPDSVFKESQKQKVMTICALPEPQSIHRADEPFLEPIPGNLRLIELLAEEKLRAKYSSCLLTFWFWLRRCVTVAGFLQHHGQVLAMWNSYKLRQTFGDNSASLERYSTQLTKGELLIAGLF